MANYFQMVLIVSVVAVVAVCNATPANLDKYRTAKNRKLARQVAVDDEDIPVQTPYPSAGFRPEVPFVLPTEEKLIAPSNSDQLPLINPAMFYSGPAEVYGPPVETYGPPEITDGVVNVKSVTEIPECPEEGKPTEVIDTEEAVTEDTISTTPTEEDQEDTIEDTAEISSAEAEEENLIPENLVLVKSEKIVRAAKLRKLAPLTQKQNKDQQFYLINGSLYTAA